MSQPGREAGSFPLPWQTDSPLRLCACLAWQSVLFDADPNMPAPRATGRQHVYQSSLNVATALSPGGNWIF